jgi:hypothetical protein
MVNPRIPYDDDVVAQLSAIKLQLSAMEAKMDAKMDAIECNINNIAAKLVVQQTHEVYAKIY